MLLCGGGSVNAACMYYSIHNESASLQEFFLLAHFIRWRRLLQMFSWHFLNPQSTAATQELFLLIRFATSGGGSFVSRLTGERVLHYFSLTKIRRGWDKHLSG